MKEFKATELHKLYQPSPDSSGEENGQVTIVGGSKLFHGAPLYAVKLASRMVDMVFFASPEKSVGDVANKMKSKLFSFIWIPWEDTKAYIKKSDAVLIGPGFMRFGSEETPDVDRSSENHQEGQLTMEITKDLLKDFPDKKWVIDAGSLQTMNAGWIPKGAIITPNRKEYELLFGDKLKDIPQKVRTSHSAKSKRDDEAGLSSLPASSNVQAMAKKYDCIIVSKGPETIVCSPDECVVVKGGNAGLTKGGTGDVLAGLTVALLAKNDPFLSACTASYVAKAAADELYKKVGPNYNADDLADKIPESLHELTT